MVAPNPDYTPHPLTPPNSRIKWVEKQQDDVLSSTAFSIMQQHHNTINGLSLHIPCVATNVSNLYTLTPFNVSPVVPYYVDFWGFQFVASATSTGLVTATVVPATGSLPTLKVMKTNGSAQATVGDIVINLFYIVYFVDSLDGGNGAFVLK